MSKNSKKNPKYHSRDIKSEKKIPNVISSNEKIPKATENPNAYFHQKPYWSFSKCDWNHEKWGINSNSSKLPGILRRMNAFEGMTWNEILSNCSGRKNNTQNHEIKLEKIEKSALKRFMDLNLDEYDSLYSFTVTGSQRIWGVRIDNVFCIVWIDAKHEICPSHKRHT